MSPSAAQRIEGTPGLCTNLDYCSIGMHREVVAVPIGEAFVCPECGKKLRPPALRGLQRPIVLPALRIAILCIGTILGYGIGRLMPPRAPPAATKTQIALSPATVASPAETHSAHLHPRETAGPAQHLLHEQHFGQVTLDCVFPASHAAATCRTGDVRGSDFFSDGALQWLQNLRPPYPPGPDHRWHIIIEDSTGQAPVR